MDLHDELIEYLSQFMTLTDEEVRAVKAAGSVRRYEKGTVLLRAGERSKKSYFVLRGCVRTFYVIDGEERTTAFYTEHQAILPACAVNHSPSEYTLVCLEDTAAVTSSTDAEQSVFDQFPRFHSVCSVRADQELAQMQRSFEQYMNSTPEQRYLRLVEERPDLIQRVPQYHLASYIGVKPESLSRIRKRLARPKESRS